MRSLSCFTTLLLLFGLTTAFEGISVKHPFQNRLRHAERQLQSQANGFFRNVIAILTLPSRNQNLVEVNLIYDVAITGGSIDSLTLGVFDTGFGNFGRNDVLAFFDDVELPSSNISVGRRGTKIVVSVDFSLRNEGDFTINFKYKIDNLICQHSDAEQAISATWINFLTSTSTRQVEVDYILPLGDGEDEFPPDFAPTFTPNTDSATTLRKDDNLTFFLPYDPNSLNFNAADNTVSDMFLLFGENVFPPEEVSQCNILAVESAYALFVVGILVTLCICVVIGAIYQKFVESNMQQRRYRRRDRNLNIFPGNPDIILRPDSDGPGTTVRAVMESDDVNDFDDVVPVTTINVAPETQRNTSFEEEAGAGGHSVQPSNVSL